MLRAESLTQCRTSCRQYTLASIAALSMLAVAGCGSNLTLPGSSSPGPTVSAVPAGPQLGYAWLNDARTLRPILGLPGSSLIGESVVPANTYVNAEASARSAIALLVGTDQQVYSMNLPNGAPSSLGFSAGASPRIRFSPSGTSAVLYTPGSMNAVAVLNLKGTPQIKSIALPSPAIEMTSSDAGVIAVSLDAANGVSTGVLTPSNSFQQLVRLGGTGGLAFIGSTDDLLAADSVADALTLVRSSSTAPSATIVASAGLLRAPVAVGAARGGRWAVVANGGDSSVVRVDLSGATPPQRLACASQPKTVEQLGGNGVFRFTDIGNSPAWIADITASTPNMLFIPAIPAVTGGPAAKAVGR